MRQIVCRLLSACLVVPVSLSALAQGVGVVKGDCTPGITGEAAYGLMPQAIKNLSTPTTGWNPDKVYHQLVILVSYADTDFTETDANRYYDRVFNEQGYNGGAGAGSIADYFREQSNGLFNVQFDIYGPFQTAGKAQPYDNPNGNTRNYGASVMREATLQMIAQNPDLDYKQYDWNGDGRVNQVIYIYAGISGNQGSESYGYVWPNTYTFTTVTTPDGTTIRDYSCSAELWTKNRPCGIGTVCHEFSHSLGLPDIYPTGGNSGYYSVADEWDLMDGGNFTNSGWCPPNYTPLEKMLMGWLTPVELTAPTTVTGLKAVSDGGETYIIKHTDHEYLLLENRQWTGWDAGLPGKGLVVYHVDYDQAAWLANTVNNTKGHFRFDLVHADNMDYEQWSAAIAGTGSQYAGSNLMHNRHLSTSPYPWTDDAAAFLNNALTDTSVPATIMFNGNAAGDKLLSKAVTNIQMSDDGLISFDFMGGTPSAIAAPRSQSENADSRVYNIMGQRVSTPRKGLLIKNGKKYISH